MTGELTFQIGGMWERDEWYIRFGMEVPTMHMTPCKHCGPPYQRMATDWSRGRTETVVVCPRMVIAVNEGGHNSTGVCLDCILEAAAGLP